MKSVILFLMQLVMSLAFGFMIWGVCRIGWAIKGLLYVRTDFAIGFEFWASIVIGILCAIMTFVFLRSNP